MRFGGARHWLLADRYGRSWILRVTSMERPTEPPPLSALEGLIHEAFAPWGLLDVAIAGSLLEVCDALGDTMLARQLRDRDDGDDPLEPMRLVGSLLMRALERGWLVCEPLAPPPLGPIGDAPDTEREPPALVPETTTWFELLVVDEVGEPIDGIDIAFGVGGTRRVVATDGRGVARLEDANVSFVSARVATLEQVRDKLAPRWIKPRLADLPTGPDVHVAELDLATESLSLESEKPATLAIMPLFRCNELSGVHSAFARSFLLESALDTLSVMAAAITEDENRRAMIFGHTDTSGSEELNKALSERRARVVLTVLTHDTNAWEQLWTGSDDSPHFKEQWGLKEAQHLLNALGVTDDDGNALVEDGVDGPATGSAMRRFQRGDYDGAREGRSALPVTGKADRATRKEFLLSFADEVTRDPIPKDRFSPIGDASFMGCGEYNPLSDHARDAASRRTVLFVFDRAAEPQNLPCKLRKLGPCKGAGGVDDPLPDPLPDNKPYRCSIYREIAKTCPCVKGEELMHLEVQLHDRNFDPAPETHYEAVIEGAERVFGTTDSKGILHAAVRKSDISLRVTYQPLSEPSPVTVDALILLPDQDETDRAFVQKIRNLGFGAQGDSDAFAIRKFQGAHKNLKRTGLLDDATKQAVRDLENSKLRPAFEDDAKQGKA